MAAPKQSRTAPPRSATRTAAPVSALDSHLGYWLRFVSNHVSQSFQRKVEAAGVTVSEWVILRELHRLGSTSPGALAQVIGMSKGAVSKLMARLEGKDLVTRLVVAEDRRQHEIGLTRTGRLLVPRLARLADQNDAEYFGHLTQPQRETLLGAMQEIVRIHGLKEFPVD